MTERKRRAGNVLLFPSGKKIPCITPQRLSKKAYINFVYLTKLKDILHHHHRKEGRIYLCIRSQRHNHFQLNKDARTAKLTSFPFDSWKAINVLLLDWSLSCNRNWPEVQSWQFRDKSPEEILTLCSKIQDWHTIKIQV